MRMNLTFMPSRTGAAAPEPRAGSPRGAGNCPGRRPPEPRAGPPRAAGWPPEPRAGSRSAGTGWPTAHEGGRRLTGVPEGDAVWLTARRLHAALAGRVLTRSDFRVPRFATADLSGQTVTETASRGKHLLTRTDAGITVHTHLRMDGSWRVRPAAERASGGHRIRLILANDTWQAVGYLLGVVEILPTAAEHTRGRPPRPRPARPGLGPGGGGTPAARGPGPAGRRGPARPAQPGR